MHVEVVRSRLKARIKLSHETVDFETHLTAYYVTHGKNGTTAQYLVLTSQARHVRAL